jgi:hypothetical protein
MSSSNQPIPVRFTPNGVLLASIIALGATALMLVGAALGWHDIFTTLVFSICVFVHPLLAYSSVRMMTHTGWSWRLFSAFLASVLGLGLWAGAVYIVVYLRYT